MEKKGLLVKICILFFFLTSISNAQDLDTTDTTQRGVEEPITINLNTFVESSQVPLNRKVKYHVELSWIGDLSRIQIEPIEQPILTNLLLEGSGSSNKLEPLNDNRFRSIKTITYQFKPVEMGMAYVDGLVIKYQNTVTGEEDELQAQRVMIEITEPLDQGSGDGVKAFIYVILLVIFFGAMAFFLAKYLNKRKINTESLPEQICLPREYLTRISQDINPQSNNLAEMTSRLSKIFREYLSKDFHIAAREASSQEIIEQLRIKQVDANDLDNMKELFEKLDRIKFGGESLNANELSNIYGTIEAFLIKQIEKCNQKEENNKEA